MKLAFRTGAWALLLSSCAALQAPAPDRRLAETRVWDVPPSTLTVPLSIPAAQARTWAESSVPKTVEGNGSGQRTLSAWFMKHDWHYWWTYRLVRSPLKVGFEANRIRVAASLSGELSARWDTLPGDITSEVEADAGVEAELTVGADWKLRPETRVFLDVRRADVPIGIAWDGNFFGETISIAAPVQEALKPSLAALDKELTRWLSTVDLRPGVETAWRELQEPRALGGQDLWLTLGPQAVSLGPIQATSDSLGLTLTLTARPGLTQGPRPDPVRRPLPPVTEAPALPGRSVVNLPVTLEWAEAARVARSRLGPQGELAVGNGGRLAIQGLELSARGDRILVKVAGKVSPPWPGPAVEAVVWLEGLPLWEPVTRSLKLTDLTLEVRTKDYLTQAAAWLLNGAWVTALEQTLAWDMGPELDRLRNQASAALASLPMAPHLVLSGRIDSLQVVDFTLTDRGPEILGRLEGTAEVNWVP